MTIEDISLSQTTPSGHVESPTKDPTPENEEPPKRKQYRKTGKKRRTHQQVTVDENENNSDDLYEPLERREETDIYSDLDPSTPDDSEEGSSGPDTPSDLSDLEIELRQPPKKKRVVVCSCKGVPRKEVERLDRRSLIYAGMETLEGCFGIFRTLRQSKNDRDALSHVCHRHLVILGGCLGLQTNEFNKKELERRLNLLWDNRKNLTAFKTAQATSKWFRL